MVKILVLSYSVLPSPFLFSTNSKVTIEVFVFFSCVVFGLTRSTIGCWIKGAWLMTSKENGAKVKTIDSESIPRLSLSAKKIISSLLYFLVIP